MASTTSGWDPSHGTGTSTVGTADATNGAPDPAGIGDELTGIPDEWIFADPADAPAAASAPPPAPSTPSHAPPMTDIMLPPRTSSMARRLPSSSALAADPALRLRMWSGSSIADHRPLPPLPPSTSSSSSSPAPEAVADASPESATSPVAKSKPHVRWLPVDDAIDVAPAAEDGHGNDHDEEDPEKKRARLSKAQSIRFSTMFGDAPVEDLDDMTLDLRPMSVTDLRVDLEVMRQNQAREKNRRAKLFADHESTLPAHDDDTETDVGSAVGADAKRVPKPSRSFAPPEAAPAPVAPVVESAPPPPALSSPPPLPPKSPNPPPRAETSPTIRVTRDLQDPAGSSTSSTPTPAPSSSPRIPKSPSSRPARGNKEMDLMNSLLQAARSQAKLRAERDTIGQGTGNDLLHSPSLLNIDAVSPPAPAPLPLPAYRTSRRGSVASSVSDHSMHSARSARSGLSSHAGVPSAPRSHAGSVAGAAPLLMPSSRPPSRPPSRARTRTPVGYGGVGGGGTAGPGTYSVSPSTYAAYQSLHPSAASMAAAAAAHPAGPNNSRPVPTTSSVPRPESDLEPIARVPTPHMAPAPSPPPAPSATVFTPYSFGTIRRPMAGGAPSESAGSSVSGDRSRAVSPTSGIPRPRTPTQTPYPRTGAPTSPITPTSAHSFASSSASSHFAPHFAPGHSGLAPPRSGIPRPKTPVAVPVGGYAPPRTQQGGGAMGYGHLHVPGSSGSSAVGAPGRQQVLRKRSSSRTRIADPRPAEAPPMMPLPRAPYSAGAAERGRAPGVRGGPPSSGSSQSSQGSGGSMTTPTAPWGMGRTGGMTRGRPNARPAAPSESNLSVPGTGGSRLPRPVRGKSPGPPPLPPAHGSGIPRPVHAPGAAPPTGMGYASRTSRPSGSSVASSNLGTGTPYRYGAGVPVRGTIPLPMAAQRAYPRSPAASPRRMPMPAEDSFETF
ncbi:hypothetical protein AMAG_00681 [Allomyces macrogynus ATCC 38327]|uniref:Uncharacterized protein n=1 Tax=Allomyces macrogynus (strain ATCC 38327) TaxID=578462 RepID=A0A0L0RWF8_ALLM3|nr:hypothetical protein AMAG_00681 [Allomyces macrogynus ATCC 38327]|eukprot:KNE54722.1 hypothetical protein AMAG_00681 [Allomyces macrogynus ATCC 38327]